MHDEGKFFTADELEPPQKKKKEVIDYECFLIVRAQRTAGPRCRVLLRSPGVNALGVGTVLLRLSGVV